MVVFSPKIELINHFDELINQVDIDIEKSLEKHYAFEVLGELDFYQVKNRNIGKDCKYKLDFTDSYKLSTSSKQNRKCENLWCESTKVVDYLNQIRIRTIEELRKAQEESLKNSTDFSHLRIEMRQDEDKIEELRSQLFAKRFYFQINLTLSKSKSWIFKSYIFLTDFYMSSSNIKLLEKFVNAGEKPFSPDSMQIFDENMVLICLLHKHICNNITTQTFPNQLIQVTKQELLNISLIEFRYDNIRAVNLSKDLSSLKVLRLEFSSSLDEICFKLNSLKEVYFKSGLKINSDLKNYLFNSFLFKVEQFYFKELNFVFHYSSFERNLLLRNIENESLNFDLIADLCGQIEELVIFTSKSENISKLLSSHYFPNLKSLMISQCEIVRVEKKLFGELGLATLEKLIISNNKDLGIIDRDAFSNLTQLVYLYLNKNRIESLDTWTFLELANLNFLDLSYNRLKTIDENLFSGQQNLKTLYLRGNKLSDKMLEKVTVELDYFSF